jgi:benzodiazapine receptor
VTKLKTVLKFAIALAVCFAAGGIGALFTTQDSISTWYTQLQKPDITPPAWVFGPVWTILYLLMAISAFLVWNSAQDYSKVRQALVWFLIQLALNAAWTLLFFGFHLVFAAFLDILLLWLVILVTIFAFASVSVTAAMLLVPYFLWVGFAAILNGSIYHLNQ